MEIRLEANARSSPAAGCDWIFDATGIHKNLSPFGLRIFLAQRRMFLSRRIALDTPLSEILFALSKIFRNAPNANF
ncbi:MAG TPA: hypothetical protein DET40_02710 [Lentisphaeria bacterium]|nr:MAG: hypothetical protein A2X45_13900 [Lentisphaerae bacterium GWF2_50_93]HCE42442.1 hypothetical protein [Lentisphaeria bacterium]